MTPAEEIKAKIDLVELIREYIQVKPAGRNFQALCPFHNEKSPSFIISPEKQIWHCFGCAKGGDVFAFVMEKEGLTFGEALRHLAAKAGVNLPDYSPAEASQKNRLLDILEAATVFYERALRENKLAEAARRYLAERGLTDELIEDWRLGFSPDSWDDLILFLKGRGFTEYDITAAGLAVQKAGTGRYYNRFRGRIMFPLSDVNNNIVGFTARVLPERDGQDGMGKYVNSPQGEIFDKSKILFGLNKAKAHIREQGYVIIVEGQMDVITAHQYGFKNVVAKSGLGIINLDQINLIKRFANKIMLVLDSDSAGKSSAIRELIEILYYYSVKFVNSRDRYGTMRKVRDVNNSEMIEMKIVSLSVGKDADECIRINKAAWIKSLSEAKSLMKYYFDNVLSHLNLDKIEGRKEAINKILPIVSKLPNPAEKTWWVKKLSEVTNVDDKLLFEKIPKESFDSKFPIIEYDPSQMLNQTKREEILSEHLLALVCRFPGNLQFLFYYVLPEHLVGEGSQHIYKNLILYYNQYQNNQDSSLDLFALDYSDFHDWLVKNQQTVAARALEKIIIIGEKEFGAYDAAGASLAVKSISNELKRRYLNGRIKALSKLIAEAESASGDSEQLNDLLKEFTNLTVELRKISD